MLRHIGRLHSDSLKPHFFAAYGRIAHYAIRKFLVEFGKIDSDGNYIVEKLPDGAFDEWCYHKVSEEIYGVIFSESEQSD